MPKHYLPTGLLLLLHYLAVAQPNQVHFTSLAARDGLLSNSVNAIIKDRWGLMWFATDDGLNKFDGTNFTVYRHHPGDSGSLRANEVLALYEDGPGNLWVGTGGGGLSRYDRKKDAFVHYPTTGDFAGLNRNAVIRGICSDYSGYLWIAQYNGLYVLNPSTNTVTQKPLLPSDWTTPIKTIYYCVFEDHQ